MDTTGSEGLRGTAALTAVPRRQVNGAGEGPATEERDEAIVQVSPDHADGLRDTDCS
jgi:hypothetical protein